MCPEQTENRQQEGEIIIPVSATTSVEHLIPPEKADEDNIEGIYTSTMTESIDLSEEEQQPMKVSCHKCQQKLDVSSLAPFAHFNCPCCGEDLIVPKWFENYLLEQPQGIGGMAKVYRALDLTLDREVAIKILNPDIGSEKEKKELFLYEARTAATINHYAVIPIFTCGEYEKQAYIVMQYMGCGSLEEKLKIEGREGLPVKDVAKWIRDIAEGLDNARRHGIIHHDVKPGNIMLDFEGNAKIGDFGISQAMNDLRSDEMFKITKSWISPHYVSPEKVVEGKEDFRGDIYSLGATFYHLILGDTPFDHDDIDELIKIRLMKDPVPPHKVSDKIPKEISKLVISMMDKDYTKRPDYREIIRRLNSFLKGRNENKRSDTTTSKNVKKTMVNQEKLDEVFSQKGVSNKKGFPFAAISFLFLIVAVITAAAWKFGYLDKLFISKQIVGTKEEAATHIVDLLPEITLAFAQGNTTSAEDLARNALEDSGANLEKKKQAALQLAFANYLNRHPEAEYNCSFIAEKLSDAGVSGNDPSLTILRFMERRDIKPEALYSKIGESPDYKSVAHLAVFLRQLYNEKSINDVSSSFAVFSTTAQKLSDDHWAKAWTERIKIWKSCFINRKIHGNKKIEPIIKTNLIKILSDGKPPAPVKNIRKNSPARQSVKQVSKGINILDLNKAWLEKNRLYAARRPALNSFTVPEFALMKYLKTIPAKNRDSEKKRAEQIGALKKSLQNMLSQIPYEGSVKLKNSPEIKGKIFISGKNMILSLPGGKNHKNIQMEEIPEDLYINMVLYYIALKEKALSVKPSLKSSKEIAMLYMRVAILYDWLKQYGNAVNFFKKALNSDKNLEKEISEYII